MTEAEVVAAARTDADNPPMTKAQASRMKPVALAKRVRWKLGLSQEEFALRFGIPLGTLRDWEQHRTEPDQTSMNYLKVIMANPKAVQKALEPA
jgi:putative transcriptional regulator